MLRNAAVVMVAVTIGAAPVRAQGDADQARSKALYQEGSRAYKDGEYERAVELFLSAYDLSRAPAILFNIAQAYRLAGSCDRALAYYRRSLAEEPDASNRAEVEERIAEMERCADQKAQQQADPESAAGAGGDREAEPPAAATTPVRLTAQAPERPASERSRLPLVTVGLGAAAALAGGVIYFQARAKFDEVEDSCPCEPGSFSGWETATDASYVLMGAGVVAAGAGLVWWWRQSHREPRRLGLVPAAGGIGWAGSF